ncbi:acyltransferase [Ancylomarina sp. DW003]|nr:acyltransferase [Ancylomarina sp. DW003]MDE5422308.1 acyltransferase [Ancylomarina sp. DW003]
MEKQERRFDIDWMRILLILSVFIFHIGMFFNSWGWHVKNNIELSGLNRTMEFMHYWRMPLLFFISGAGTFLALGSKTLATYAGERARRLMIPFLIGIFTLVPIQVYLEKFDEYSSLWNFYTHMFEGVYPEGNFSWHHLWFIIYLFFISIVAIPCIKWLRSEKSKALFAFIDNLSQKKGALLLLGLPILVSQMILRPYWPESTHAFVNDWAYMMMYFLFFICGYIFAKSKAMYQSIIKQRYTSLFASILVTVFMFNSFNLISDNYWAYYFYGCNAILLAWFMGITAMGFCGRYMNFDSPFRKKANEAIYPFYLLHQPIILLVGFYMKDMDLPIGLKATVLCGSSFFMTVLIYLTLVRPFNFMRVVFGLKTLRTADAKLKVNAIKV